MGEELQTCPHCGLPLRVSAPDGLCPVCVLRRCLAAEQEPEPLPSSPATEQEETVQGDRAAPPGRIHQRFGDYELTEEIGRGGMGIVYKARQLSLNRWVALKTISPTRLGSAVDVQRFRMEVEAAGRLEHPNILPVHEFGEHQGQYFYAMKLVEGGNLLERIADCGLPRSEAPTGTTAVDARERQRGIAQLLITIARAVAYAHQRGILHRDLKPANILLDASGVPYVSDFGLAKFLDEDLGLTVSLAVVGTPGYMSPEQASGKSKALTMASDVYGLGAILYELLTGQAPFRGSSVEVLRLVVEEPPKAPHQLNGRVDRDLETICLKCLNKEPTRRYAGAEELAEDLERWLAGEPIEARPVHTGERVWLWCQRKPALAVALASVLAALGIGLATTSWQWRQTRQQAEANRRNAYAADMLLAQRELEVGNVGAATALLDRHRPKPGEKDLRHWEWRYLRQQCLSDALAEWKQGSTKVSGMCFVDGGKLLAAGDEQGQLVFWDVGKQTAVQRVDVGSPITCLRASRGGGLLAVGCSSNGVQVWDRQSQRKLYSLACSGSLLDLAFSPDNQFLATLDAKQLSIWDLRNGSAPARIVEQTHLYDFGGSVDFSPKGDLLAWAVGMWDFESGLGRIRLLRWPGLAEVATIGAHWNCARRVRFSPDGRQLASCAIHGESAVKLWEVPSGQALGTLLGHQAWVCALEFLPDGQTLVTAGSDQMIKVWDVKRRKERATLKGHRDEVWSLAIHPEEGCVVSGARDGTIAHWASPEAPSRWHETTMVAGEYAFLPDGVTLATVHSGMVVLWDLDRLEDKTMLEELGLKNHGLALSGSGRFLATGSTNGLLQVWDLAEKGVAARVKEHEGRTMPLGFFDEDNRLVSADETGRVAVWEVGSWRVARWLQVPPAQQDPYYFTRISLCAERGWLVKGTPTGDLLILDLRTGRERYRVRDLGPDPFAVLDGSGRWISIVTGNEVPGGAGAEL